MTSYRAEIWDNSGYVGVIFDVVERRDLSDVNVQIQKESICLPKDNDHEFSIKTLVFRTDELRETIAKIGQWASIATEIEIDERTEVKAVGADKFVFELRPPQSYADNTRGMADLLITVEYSRLSFSISMLVDHSCLDQFGQSVQRTH